MTALRLFLDYLFGRPVAPAAGWSDQQAILVGLHMSKAMDFRR